MKRIALIGTLDTKGEEVRYMKNLFLENAHCQPLVIDIGTMGQPAFVADIKNEDVLRTVGKSLQEIVSFHDEGKALRVMTVALTTLIRELYQQEKIDGIVAIGGGQGSAMASPALQQLPVGFPKVLVSTKAVQAGIQVYAGSKDVVIIPAVSDIAGLNRLTRKVLANAVGCIIGMVDLKVPVYDDKPVVVMSMNGCVTKCCLYLQALLEKDGYEVVTFHSLGIGGKAMEAFISDCPDVKAVVELGLNEIGNELFGGMASAGKERLEGAGKKGLPQIVTPGSVDFINFLTPETVPAKYKDRRLHSHNPQATTLRMEKDELETIGRVVAEKLNNAKGRVEMLIPSRGFSMWDQEGNVFYDPESDKAFIDAFMRTVSRAVEVFTLDMHINDGTFGDFLYGRLTEIMKNRE
jgi:uncharacterized protein (UPF0261 family)